MGFIRNKQSLKDRQMKLFSLAIVLFFSSCVQDSPRSSRSGRSSTSNAQNSSASPSASGSSNNQNSASQASAFSSSLLDEILEDGESEIRHIVDPFTGTYKTKVTIPKNFKGYLYLSGINITALSNKVIKARFKFGRELEPITVDATIGKAPGITPQTDIDVLILDMNNVPFKDMRLLYDLYDYNDYRDGTGAEVDEPVSDPRNSGLYCRGLKLEHDPTFESTVGNTTCDSAGEKCLYSYAKVKDAGLYYLPTGSTTYVSYTPNRPQIDLGTTGYTNQSQSSLLTSCLPDNLDLSNFNSIFLTSLTGSMTYDKTVAINAVNYLYRGPFRFIGQSSWEISSSALVSLVNAATAPTGLFQVQAGTAPNLMYYRSFLFPRAGKMTLKSSVGFFGDSDPFAATRTLDTLVTSGASTWMNGCSLRVSNYDTYTSEGLASCNVSATIELLYIDNDGQEIEIPNTVTSKVKLQLIRPSLTNYEGKEVLYSSMKTCSGSNACASDECCYNQRCWSKDLVSTCLEDAQAVGNAGVGEVCSSDYECSSLCCGTTSTCQPHVNTSQEQVLCSKSAGQSCVAKEWCRKENVQTCYIVKTGFSTQGVQQCALRCYNVPTHGTCLNGTCGPPTTPTVPSFDPSNPDCSSAIDPPSNI